MHLGSGLAENEVIFCWICMVVLAQGKCVEMQDLWMVQEAIFPCSFSGNQPVSWLSYSNCRTAA